MHAAMLNASKYYNSEISDESVAIMAPYFGKLGTMWYFCLNSHRFAANEADAGVGYPVNSALLLFYTLRHLTEAYM